ncbi:ATP-binding protein [Actinokineospora enzanensis]|uniref:ATP-binding protein n=1 Tax=Actinokineospora enzanensis TaxID=155975 RepID=UPI0003782191|nr:hypothetical protein [Actinokineospora enzanensis]
MSRFKDLNGPLRRQVAERLWGAWESGENRGLILTGESGTGKTRQVVWPLLNLVRRFKGIAISIDVPESPVDLEAHLFGKLEECDEAIGDPRLKEQIRDSRGFFAAVRTLLARKSIVVIDEFQRGLDDKAHPFRFFADKLQDLATRTPRGGCLLIVSNRKIDPLWTEPFLTQRLDPPAEQDALKIALSQIAEDKRADVLPADRHAEVVNRLGRNPRALRLLSALLADDHLLEDLLGPPEPLTAPVDTELVRGVEHGLVAKAVQGMPDAARAALRNLSVLADWAEAGLVQAVTGIDAPVESNDLTRQLFSRFLVESWTRGPQGRRVTQYQVHPAVREVDRVRLHDDEDAWKAAHLRAGAWFAKGLVVRNPGDHVHQARLAIALAGIQRHYVLAGAQAEFAQVIQPVVADIERRFGTEYRHVVPESRMELDARIELLTAYFDTGHENVHLRYHLARLFQVREDDGDLERGLTHAEKATETLDSFYPWMLRLKIAWAARGDTSPVDIADEALRRVKHVADDSSDHRFSFFTHPAMCLVALGETRTAVENLRQAFERKRVRGSNCFRLIEPAIPYCAVEADDQLLADLCRWLDKQPDLSLQADQAKIAFAMCQGRWDEAAKRAKIARRSAPRYINFATYESIALLATGRAKEAHQLLIEARIPDSQRYSRRSEFREGKAWLASFAALEAGELETAHKWLTAYLGEYTADWSPVKMKARLLYEWDNRVGTMGEANPAYVAPVLPDAMTGCGDARRPQYGPPVLPRRQVTEEESPTVPPSLGVQINDSVVYIGSKHKGAAVTNGGSKFTFQGEVKAGVIGDNATVASVSFDADETTAVDPVVLLKQLKQLRGEMVAKSATGEQKDALESVDEAIAAAEEGDAPRTERRLRALGKSAGTWAIGLATSIGAGVAVTVLKSTLGL